PLINITIGNEGPYLALLATVPATLADARDALQAAIRSAHSSLPFAAARVVSVANRLIVLPGTYEELVIEIAGTDPTATELRLDPGSARRSSAVVSGAIPSTISLTAGTPALSVMVGTDG